MTCVAIVSQFQICIKLQFRKSVSIEVYGGLLPEIIRIILQGNVSRIMASVLINQVLVQCRSESPICVRTYPKVSRLVPCI